MSQVSVARQFSVTPGGRYRRISEYSGEQFREELLNPVVASGKAVTVDLDGVMGYGSSFLEEVFGGLVRDMGWTERSQFDKLVNVVTRRRDWAAEVDEYVNAALEQTQQERVKASSRSLAHG